MSFNLSIGQIHKPIVFSTSPHAKYTHWKQTIFYLVEPVTACTGEELSGQIVCNQNAKNKRDLDIEISYDFHGRHGENKQTQMYHLR